MTQLPIRAVGIPWYRREDYARVRKLFKDGDQFPATFDHWLKAAEKTKQVYEADGYIVLKAYIDPSTFPVWCKTRGLDIDANARTEFGSWFAAQAYRQTH